MLPTLNPGYQARLVLDPSGCCQQYEAVCQPLLCPQVESSCASPRLVRPANTSDCCPTLDCGRSRNMLKGKLEFKRILIMYSMKCVQLENTLYMYCSNNNNIHHLYYLLTVCPERCPATSELFCSEVKTSFFRSSSTNIA